MLNFVLVMEKLALVMKNVVLVMEKSAAVAFYREARQSSCLFYILLRSVLPFERDRFSLLIFQQCFNNQSF